MIRIKIKDLARELGVTSRMVLDRCRALDLPAQNSISKLDPHQANLVRGLIEGAVDGPDAADTSAPEGPGVPGS